MITLDLSNKTIKTAEYGTLDNYINVINIINKLIIHNITSFIVSNKLFKKDPYYGKVKELVLVFSNNQIISIKDGTHVKIININNNIANIDIDSKLEIINNKNSNNYILAAFVKDEYNVLEWIIYHLLIGFDKILIIDNNSKNPVRNIIKKYKFKDKVDIIETDKTGIIKLYFLNEIILPYMKKECNKYFINIDVDEYINLNDNYETVGELLEEYNVNILPLGKLIFGSNNKKINESNYKGLIPTYTKASTNIFPIYNYFINIKSEPIEYIMDKDIYEIKVKHGKIFSSKDFKSKVYDAPAFINNYAVQSFNDYNRRKIYRTKIDKMSCHKFNNTTLTLFNDKQFDNLNRKYTEVIKYTIANNIIDIGFIILRYVNSTKTNKYWQECYDCIRTFYSNKIVIIDDNSNLDFLTNDKELINCEIIKSDYPQRGELLPYYYYYHNKFCDRVIVLHDTMFIKKKINLINIVDYNCFTRIFSFGIKAYNSDIDYFKEQTTFLKHGNDVYQYHLNNKTNLLGCLGVSYVIDYSFLYKIQNKYNILNLVNTIHNREHRKTLERLLSCLFEKEMSDSGIKTRYSLLGDIHKNINKQKINENSVYIQKIFTGR